MHLNYPLKIFYFGPSVHFTRVLETLISRSVGQGTLQILWYQRVYYWLLQGLPIFPVLSQMNPVQTLISNSLQANFTLFLHLCLGLPIGRLPSCLQLMFCTHVSQNCRHGLTCELISLQTNITQRLR
jgi:hypothetical protein